MKTTTTPGGLAILALDLAEHTGWARLDEETGLRSGVLDFTLRPDEHPGERYGRFREAVLKLAWGADVVCWERIVSYGGGGNALGILYGFESHVVEVVFAIRAEVRTVNPATLKKHATGNGRADKAEMVAAARRRWPGVKIERHDHADALLILAWSLENVGDLPARAPRVPS